MARRLVSRQIDATFMLTPLFDRFQSDQPAGLDELARDIADILGARRVFSGRAPGLLGWGLPGIAGLAPNSEKDREEVATIITTIIERFEPRLERVQVTPIPDTVEFSFLLEAELIQTGDEMVTLRILSPRRGGALGADIAVLDGS